jgi:hypothetical protein
MRHKSEIFLLWKDVEKPKSENARETGQQSAFGDRTLTPTFETIYIHDIY